MNNSRQIYKETKLKLDSMTIILLITMAVAAVFMLLAIFLDFNNVWNSGFAPGGERYANYMTIIFLAVVPLILSSFAIAIFHNIKNNKKSFDNIGSTNATYCMSNNLTLLIMAIIISVFCAMFEMLIILVAGATPAFPIIANIAGDLMTIIWTNFGIYLLISYCIFQVVTYFMNNIMNRNYLRAILLTAIPIVLIVSYSLIVELCYRAGRIPYYNLLRGSNIQGIVVLSGVLISNILDTVLCFFGGRIR